VEEASRLPVLKWLVTGRDRLSGQGDDPALAEKWVKVSAETKRIKSGNYAQTPQGIVPVPNELLLLDTGSAVRDGAVRVRLARSSVAGVRLFVRMGAGDYAAIIAADKVTIRGGLHGATYKDLRSFPLPPGGSNTDEIEAELRVVGSKITVLWGGAEVGSLEDQTVTSGSLGAGSFKPDKVVFSGFEYLNLDPAKP
jgi:hypothetical protein